MREDGCPVQTTEWSACSRNCGWGIRERVTNDNEDCDMRKETVLCQLRPCHYELIVKDRLKVINDLTGLSLTYINRVKATKRKHV